MSDLSTLQALLGAIAEALDRTDELPRDRLNDITARLQAVLELIQTVAAEPQKPVTIEIWTDGACTHNPGPGGWGTIIRREGRKQEFSGFKSHTTNNIMEMTGALEGLRRTPTGAHIVLTSDSQYLVKGMTEWMRNWKRKNWRKPDGSPVLNVELWQALDEAASLRQITWQWTRGHSGQPENERCDELARQAIQTGLKG